MTLIVRARARDFVMYARVVDTDRLTVHVYRVGNEDVAVQHLADALGDGAFAVARVAIEQQRATGVDRWPNQVAGRWAQYKVFQGVVYNLRVHLELTHRLLQRH